MDNSSESQNSLIEKYISGLMSKEESLQFEAFILTKPDWLEKVDRARELFEEIYEQEIQSELTGIIQQQTKPETPTHTPMLSWFRDLFVPLGTFALGIIGTVLLMPQQSIDPLGKIYSDVISVNRDMSTSGEQQTLYISSDTDQIILKLPSVDDLSKVFTVRVENGTRVIEREDYRPNAKGVIHFSLARDFLRDELVTVSLVDQANGKVFKEFEFKIKEK